MTPAIALLVAQVGSASDDRDIWEGWGSLILVVGVLSLLTIIVCLVIWQVFKTKQSQMASDAISGHDAAYRQLAEDATSTQRLVADDLAALKGDMADVKGRVAAIEKLLREVA